jgi:hypothetical protein
MFRETQIILAYFIFLLVSLTLIHYSHNTYFRVFKSVRFIQIFATIIENAVIHIYFKSETLRNKRLHLWNKLYPIDYSIRISFYIKYTIHVHCFIWDSQNISANSYILDTKLQIMRIIKNLFFTQVNIGSTSCKHF